MGSLKPLWLSLGAIAERLRRSQRLWVASDFDGTLTPIVERPEVAVLALRTRQALSQLAKLDRVDVAILSGRSLADLRRRVGVRGLFLSGVAGLESQDPGGRREVHVPPDRTLPEELGETMREWCKRFTGAWVEDKQLALALHYREVPPRFQAAFGSGVRRRLEPHQDRVTVVHGKKVFELLPALPWNKASALRQWWEQRRNSLLFFFGDDTHDEPVHAFVRERDGIAIAVGRTGSRAEYALPTPEEVTWMLEWLLREWQVRLGAGERSERHGAELASTLSGTVSEQES